MVLWMSKDVFRGQNVRSCPLKKLSHMLLVSIVDKECTSSMYTNNFIKCFGSIGAKENILEVENQFDNRLESIELKLN
jgi:hypothetical protein